MKVSAPSSYNLLRMHGMASGNDYTALKFSRCVEGGHHHSSELRGKDVPMIQARGLSGNLAGILTIRHLAAWWTGLSEGQRLSLLRYVLIQGKWAGLRGFDGKLEENLSSYRTVLKACLDGDVGLEREHLDLSIHGRETFSDWCMAGRWHSKTWDAL